MEFEFEWKFKKKTKLINETKKLNEIQSRKDP